MRRPPCVSRACQVGTSSTVLPRTRKSAVGRLVSLGRQHDAVGIATARLRTLDADAADHVVLDGAHRARQHHEARVHDVAHLVPLEVHVGDVAQVGAEAAEGGDPAVPDREPADGVRRGGAHVHPDLLEDVGRRLGPGHREPVERDVVGSDGDPDPAGRHEDRRPHERDRLGDRRSRWVDAASEVEGCADRGGVNLGLQRGAARLIAGASRVRGSLRGRSSRVRGRPRRRRGGARAEEGDDSRDDKDRAGHANEVAPSHVRRPFSFEAGCVPRL